MIKRILAVCLALVISCTVAIKPLNVEAAAESGILGGALAAMGVSLSVPQIALLVAAAGGAVYLYENREAVADSLETFLEVAAADLEERKQQLQDWWNAAKLGHVAISTAQDWIKDSVKDWIGSLLDGSEKIVATGSGTDWAGNPLYLTGTTVPAGCKLQYGIGESEYIVTAEDVAILRYYTEGAFTAGLTQIEHNMFLYKMGGAFKYYDSSGTLKYSNSYDSVKNSYGTHYYIKFMGREISANTVNLERLRSFKKGSYDGAYVSPTGAFAYHYDNTYNIFPMESVLNNTTVGGVKNVISDGYTMDDIYYDDLEFVGYGYITADTTKTGEAVFEESITNTLTGMQAGTITWSDYVTDVSTAPTVAVPDATDQTITNDFVIGNTGVTDTVVTPAVDPPELENYKVQLKDFFPFCLPFDIVAFIGVLAADPEAPKMDFTLPWIDGEGFTFTIDLSKWDPVAEILRTMELLALIVGLGFKTREMIRG